MLKKKNKSVVFLDQLPAIPVDEVIIHSLEGGLYAASIVMGAHTLRVYELPNTPLCRRKMSEIRSLLAPAQCKNIYLLHDSAYDEMIGSSSAVSSALRIRLSQFEESVA
ncbi:DUF6482 family protein [Spongiibacter taiwanensis]|uniref:DUF6482 family protein n=1 Tax=Spongiibacter taiwanensis TaxID=1748242 RepID=UPI0020350035|nr:DUF6482 family protein [Spongiibacter taiwanensis]USA42549.1 DUF6482 family protein [Spongiibacter taiwanensis]